MDCSLKLSPELECDADVGRDVSICNTACPGWLGKLSFLPEIILPKEQLVYQEV